MGLFVWIEDRLWHCKNKHCRELLIHIKELRSMIRSMYRSDNYYSGYNDDEYYDDDDESYDDDDESYDDDDEYYNDDDEYYD